MADFIILLLVLITIGFSGLQRLWMEYLRRRYPERYQAEKQKEEDKLKQLLKTMDIEIQEDEEEDEPEQARPLPPVPVPKSKSVLTRAPDRRRTLSDQFQFKTKMDSFQQGNAIESRTMESNVGKRFGTNYGDQLVSEELQVQKPQQKQKRKSGIHALISRYPGAQEMVISSEIFGPPKGLQ
jgi:hypothetical protein